jgi:hypothetical protein
MVFSGWVGTHPIDSSPGAMSISVSLSHEIMEAFCSDIKGPKFRVNLWPKETKDV